MAESLTCPACGSENEPGRTQLEQAEWPVSQSRAEDAAPLVDEARETFERLRATPWLERAHALAIRAPGEVPTPI